MASDCQIFLKNPLLFIIFFTFITSLEKVLTRKRQVGRRRRDFDIRLACIHGVLEIVGITAVLNQFHTAKHRIEVK